jgi:serine/threonine protein kinase/Leucine-rich repeat (LRR) protein
MSHPAESFRYKIEKLLAKGGMGEVLAADDLHFGRSVAMKVILQDREISRETRLRFVQEARILAQLEHPGIVPVYDLDKDPQGRVFYTMKFVRGSTLLEVLQRIKEGDATTLVQYPLSQLLTVFQKICDAMAYAHAKGVVHRDLKPENIMLGKFGEVLVMDWGLAKVMDDRPDKTDEHPSVTKVEVAEEFATSEDVSLTLDGAIMGTPQFMAPEQAEGRLADIDERTDIFSLGGILYNLLALRTPIGGTTVQEVLTNVRTGYIAPPVIYNTQRRRDVNGKQGAKAIELRHCPGGSIPDSLSAVAMKSMSVLPENRYQNVQELQADIIAYQNGFATQAEGASVWKQVTLLLRRHKVLAVSVVTVILLVLGFIGKVTTSERNAVRALERLRNSAPAFAAQAEALIEKQQFTEALEKIAIAIELADNQAGHHYLKGNILESLGRLADAKQSYTQALKLEPGHAFAQANLNLCEEILRAEGDRPELSHASRNKLNALMRQQGRTAEAVATLRDMSKDRKALDDTWRAVLAKAGFTKFEYGASLTLEPGGLFDLRLGNKTLADISLLRGMPIRLLVIGGSPVFDLSPLSGMPLESLDIFATKVTDLTPLSGLRLTNLSAGRNLQLRDIGPLQGMPLRFLNLSESIVEDLAPLKGMPLVDLRLSSSKAIDLTPLRGMTTLKELHLQSTKVTDLAPLQDLKLQKLYMKIVPVSKLDALKGMPLVDLDISLTSVRDISALAGMPLERLTMPDNQVTDLRPLKGMPLKVLIAHSTSGSPRPLSDISPLRGMKLKDINFTLSRVEDLSPLSGQPIEIANLRNVPVTDFSPLATWPLKFLNVGGTSFSDLRPLAGKRLETLIVDKTAISDLAPLRGMPLSRLWLHDTKVTDLRILADIPSLTELTIPTGLKDIEFLRRLPNIQRLDYKSGFAGAPPILAADFWKAHDAQKKNGK